MRRFVANIPNHEVTPAYLCMNRRRFLESILSTLASTALANSGEQKPSQDQSTMLAPPISRPDIFPSQRNHLVHLPAKLKMDLTARDQAARFNNYYEFLPGYGGQVWKHTASFNVSPWRLEVRGLCENPLTLDLNSIFEFSHEERLYHFRCVEKWAMNIPWTGFQLSHLIQKAKPLASAKFVRFESASVPSQMPGMELAPDYPWPYHEALRLDEAMNELTMLVTGAYGQPLLKQQGAPIRLIVPWKYGYKSPKAIVKIEFMARQPKTFWMVHPHEYGFLSNVNPNIPHPRWSQSRSHWLGKPNKTFKTPIFNGYEDYVASMYPDEPRKRQKPLKTGQIAR